jgi:hypothetical protein
MIKIGPGTKITEVPTQQLADQPVTSGIRRRSEQGTHVPMVPDNSAVGRAIGKIAGWWSVQEQRPVSLGGIPGTVVSGPRNGMLQFVAPAAGIDTMVSAECLCRHLV